MTNNECENLKKGDFIVDFNGDIYEFVEFHGSPKTVVEIKHYETGLQTRFLSDFLKIFIVLKGIK